MRFHAHSTHSQDRSDWELLTDHLAGVAAHAERSAAPFGLGKAARLAGQLHDLGKYDPAFQRRLAGDRVRVDHSTAGAKLLMEAAKRELAAPTSVKNRIAAELAAAAVAGHHAGLPDRRGTDDANLDARVGSYDLDERLAAEWRSVLPLDLTDLFPSGFNPSPERLFLPFQIALLGRMVFGALVDADRRVAEAFDVATGGQSQPDRDWRSLTACLAEFHKGFATRIAGFGPPATGLARLRAEILEAVREKAAMEPGLFTLNVPTGGGKTLAALGFALDHAAHHNLQTPERFRRIVCAIPFTSVTQQVAEEYRKALGERDLLEHHSGFDGDEARGAEAADSAGPVGHRQRLAMEDWAAPVIVTTHVQLFESLFAARPSRARKLPNVANSIVILDEAQVLPLGLLGPTVRCIDELARNYGCTVVLCTATQPAFDARHFAGGKATSPLALDLKHRELAPDPARLHRELKRATIRRAPAPMSDEDLVTALGGHDQALVIVNSRPHAKALFDRAKAAGLDGLVHLTTRQHAADRQRILADIRFRLRADDRGGGRPCRLIATSLVEAGVDLDFPVGWRAETGLDSIVQAAGRVNREGRRPLAESLLTVFEPTEARPPNAFKTLIPLMRATFRMHPDDPASPEAMTDYFRDVYWREDKGIDAQGILGLANHDHSRGTDIAYRTIAERYRMVETPMVPVIVLPLEKEAGIREMLATPNVPSGAIAREVQIYTVQTPRDARNRLLEAGDVFIAEPHLRADQFCLLRNGNLYRPDIGLLWENAGYMATEDMIV